MGLLRLRIGDTGVLRLRASRDGVGGLLFCMDCACGVRIGSHSVVLKVIIELAYISAIQIFPFLWVSNFY